MKTGTLSCGHDCLLPNAAKWGEFYICTHCSHIGEYSVGDRVSMQTDEWVGGKYIEAMDKTYETKSEFKADLRAKGLHVKERGEDMDAKAEKAHREKQRREKRKEMIAKNVDKPWTHNVPQAGRAYKEAGYKGNPETVPLEPGYKYGIGKEKHG